MCVWFFIQREGERRVVVGVAFLATGRGIPPKGKPDPVPASLYSLCTTTEPKPYKESLSRKGPVSAFFCLSDIGRKLNTNPIEKILFLIPVGSLRTGLPLHHLDRVCLPTAGSGGGKEMESTRPTHLCFDEHSTAPLFRYYLRLYRSRYIRNFPKQTVSSEKAHCERFNIQHKERDSHKAIERTIAPIMVAIEKKSSHVSSMDRMKNKAPPAARQS
jgi:hypothetical protein